MQCTEIPNPPVYFTGLRASYMEDGKWHLLLLRCVLICFFSFFFVYFLKGFVQPITSVDSIAVTHIATLQHRCLPFDYNIFTICGSVERVGQTMYIHGILSESFIYCEVAGFSSLRREACELKQSYHNIYLHCLIIEAINYALARF